MKHRGHGWKLRNDFAKGDLVQWNRWHLGGMPVAREGRLVYKNHMHSHLGIVLEVYRSNSKARCWTAAVRFADPVLCNDWEDARPIPLTCLVKLS